MDTLSPEKRSEVMSRVRSHGNKATELRLIAIFKASRIKGWRRHQPLLGRPDFVFPRERLVVFVDGCFWHGCSRHCRMPKSRLDYWEPKIARNKRRDRRVDRALKKEGWRVCRIWEHALATPEKVAIRLAAKLREQNSREPGAGEK